MWRHPPRALVEDPKALVAILSAVDGACRREKLEMTRRTIEAQPRV